MFALSSPSYLILEIFVYKEDNESGLAGCMEFVLIFLWHESVIDLKSNKQTFSYSIELKTFIWLFIIEI